MKKTQSDTEDRGKLLSQQELDAMIDKFVADHTATDSIEASTKITNSLLIKL